MQDTAKRQHADMDTRSAVLDAAQTLIQARGVNGISYQHISEQVGITKASIHYHFPTKDALIQGLLGRFSDQFAIELQAIDHAGGSPATRLGAYIHLFEQTFSPGGVICLCGMLGAELTSLSRASAGQIQDFYRVNLQWLERVLREGRDTGTLRFTGDPAVLALTLFSVLEGGMLVARADEGKEQYERLTRQILNTLGIVAAEQ